MERSARPFLITSLATILLVITAFWSQYRFQKFENDQIQHLLLLHNLTSGIELLVSESQKLLQDDSKLSNVQKQHDLNIVYFQTTNQGSLKLGLSPLVSVSSQDLTSLVSQFNHFSTVASALIQDRANVTKLVENRETVVLAARSLADKSSSLALGLQQINAPSEHIAAGYNLAMALNKHYLSVIRAFDVQSTYETPDLELAQQTLQSLSTGKSAPASAIIRRSAANLLTEIVAFDTYTKSISQHHQLKQSIRAHLASLTESQAKLTPELQSVSDELLLGSSSLLLFSIACWVCALGTTACAGFFSAYYFRTNRNIRQPDPVITPQPASEQTSSHYLNRLKTDKNKLMNDIRPLGEGILYIRADEHLESTGDVARCLNQSREALILKIESLRNTVNALQAKIKNSKDDEVNNHAHFNISIDTSPIENLTFKAQAELEGLQRKIKALNWNDSDSPKSLLIHCLRADRLLDEVRVRVKKSWPEMINESQRNSVIGENSNESEAIKVLINQIKENLEEFQTEAPKARRRQAV